MGRASGLGRTLARAIAGGLALGWIAATTPLGAQPSGPIRSSGSSTVGPITVLAIQGFTATGAGRGVSFKPVVENGTSAGFREFFLVGRRMGREGGTLSVCSLQPQVREIFEIAQFATSYPMYDKREAAVAAVKAA